MSPYPPTPSSPPHSAPTLSADPLDPAIQYAYRHPITVHRTFLNLSGDYLRRRFDTVEAAIKWIDERERERELIEALEGASLNVARTPATVHAATAPPSPPLSPRTQNLLVELEALRETELPVARRNRRASDPVYRFTPQSMAASGRVGGGGGISKRDERKKVVAVRGRVGSHFGAGVATERRTAALWNLVAGGNCAMVEAEEMDEDKVAEDEMEIEEEL